jgi:hypothetical protein
MSNSNEVKARIGIVLPDADRRWLKLEAANQDVPMSTLTAMIIREYIENEEANRAAKKAGPNNEGT